MRNALYVLSANGLTLLELAPLLTHTGFRTQCLKKTPNAEVRQYFEFRYDKVSEPMRATMREPILNKTSAFTADPAFRHIVGQQESTFSMQHAMTRAIGLLQISTRASWANSRSRSGACSSRLRKMRSSPGAGKNLFTIYVDEVQNFLAYDSGIETMFSEARKFGVSVVSANQYLGQYPDEMRTAILSVGTHIFFNLSPIDAAQISQALDGGKSLAERLKNLPQRPFVIKSGADHWREGCTPTVENPKINCSNLLNRARAHHGRLAREADQEIAQRHAALNQKTDEVLDDWE